MLSAAEIATQEGLAKVNRMRSTFTAEILLSSSNPYMSFVSNVKANTYIS
jgi:hypothetical protein